MKIAIISDSHDNIPNIEKFLTWAKDNQVEMIIHCGDIAAPAMIKELFGPAGIPFHCVFGNVADRELLPKICEQFVNTKCYGDTGELTVADNRVDPATGGLVQPDLSNPSDPNAGTTFDWMEFALDDSGFHGNTTCVDQFGLPITLQAVDRGGTPTQKVGLPQRRSDLLRAFRSAVPTAFQGLVSEGGLRITSPGHASSGPLATYLDDYIRAMWRRYRTEPLVLTPEEGTFTGRVDTIGRLVFRREGDPCPYVIKAMPTTLEAFRCDGPLSSGNSLERVLGAQIGAMLNRHLLDQPSLWRNALVNYESSPSNSYAEFWHRQGLGRKAYGFAYDDVNDEATLIYSADPEEIRIGFRID